VGKMSRRLHGVSRLIFRHSRVPCLTDYRLPTRFATKFTRRSSDVVRLPCTSDGSNRSILIKY
jgi:hypothetical protein